ncbi:hypothetical protein GCM10009733_040010 [Nonomuraea maheshkhaliensis]|uniref:CPBP family intramembrane metalloprotease n=1 Tax=Nonomuraea maheshkhaliensis TaxID=419590 RepID=A0ABP4R6R4_9ACTN
MTESVIRRYTGLFIGLRQLIRHVDPACDWIAGVVQFFIALGIAVARLGLLPRWVGRSAYVHAAINLAFLPAVFFGDDPADFYSAQGWGTAASMGAVWSLWTLAVSVSILRTARRPAPVTASAV